MRTRSPRTVQQMQPLFISTICSLVSVTSISLSTPSWPNSFSMTAIFWPCCSDRMRLSSVVLPAPRNPVNTVTGTSGSFDFDSCIDSWARPASGGCPGPPTWSGCKKRGASVEDRASARIPRSRRPSRCVPDADLSGIPTPARSSAADGPRRRQGAPPSTYRRRHQSPPRQRSSGKDRHRSRPNTKKSAATRPAPAAAVRSG